MTITPSTDLYLLKLPIELNDENQLTFASASAQATYFQSLTKTGATDFTYQRRDNAIRYPAHIDSILQYNYVMYKNDNYSNKWFYARIMNMQYVNDGMTLIQIEEDSFQTWQFELGYAQCFVEREHVMDDTIGANTIPENLELGPIGSAVTGEISPSANIVDSNNVSHSFLANASVIVFQASSWPSDLTPTSYYPEMGGVFSGLRMFAVTSPEDALFVIAAYQHEHTDNEIVSIFMAPPRVLNKCLYESKTVTVGSTTRTMDVMYPSTLSAVGVLDMNNADVTAPMPTNLYGDYAPKNNKLKTWPYSYLTVSNRVGDVREFHYEDFTDNIPTFHLYGVLSQGCSIKLMPKKYKPANTTASMPLEYGMNARKFPVCPWVSDAYTNWLTQNGINIATGVIGTAVSALASAASGNVFGVLGAGAQIANTVGSITQAEKLPDIAKGDVTMGDFVHGIALNGLFAVYKHSIRPEYAAIIDSYFSAYGYKVNTIKLPNVTGRTNWNYVKTIGAAFHGDMPQASCDHINKMFDTGITLWHNPATFRDYSQTNAIVTPTP